jgi:CHASE2 domain-containing sensor protein
MLASIYEQLAESARKLDFWVLAVVLIGGGVILHHVLNSWDDFVYVRDRLYHAIQNLSPYKKKLSPTTALVLIGDEEYWHGSGCFARRVPLKRDCLTKLIEKIADHNPEVIALDVDLRSPMLDGSDHPDYNEENWALWKAIKETAQRGVTIVLAATLNEGQPGIYSLEPTVLTPALDKAAAEGWRKKVQLGYINLPKDKREIPLHQRTENGDDIQSFSEAIVGAVRENTLALLDVSEELPYGGFIEAERFAKAGLVFRAEEVIRGEERSRKLAHKAVIIGGAWSRLAYGRGEKIDSHFTPAEKMAGAYIHANYVEAMLSGQTYQRLWGEKTNTAVEVLLTIGLILLHALKFSHGAMAMVVLAEGGILFTLGFFLLHNVGIFFDFFIFVVMAILHGVVYR